MLYKNDLYVMHQQTVRVNFLLNFRFVHIHSAAEFEYSVYLYFSAPYFQIKFIFCCCFYQYIPPIFKMFTFKHLFRFGVWLELYIQFAFFNYQLATARPTFNNSAFTNLTQRSPSASYHFNCALYTAFAMISYLRAKFRFQISITLSSTLTLHKGICC